MTEILEYAKDAFDYELGETTGSHLTRQPIHWEM